MLIPLSRKLFVVTKRTIRNDKADKDTIIWCNCIGFYANNAMNGTNEANLLWLHVSSFQVRRAYCCVAGE